MYTQKLIENSGTKQEFYILFEGGYCNGGHNVIQHSSKCNVAFILHFPLFPPESVCCRQLETRLYEEDLYGPNTFCFTHAKWLPFTGKKTNDSLNALCSHLGDVSCAGVAKRITDSTCQAFTYLWSADFMFPASGLPASAGFNKQLHQSGQ